MMFWVKKLTEPYLDTDDYYEQVIETFAMEAADYNAITTYEQMINNRILMYYETRSFRGGIIIYI